MLGIDLPRARDLGPVLIAWGASLLVLVFESDIGTSALFFGLFVVMMYIATQRIVVADHRVPAVRVRRGGRQRAVLARPGDRFVIWLHPFNYVHTIRLLQLVQGLYGLGFGGVLGRGLGQGQPYLTPLVQSDFIITAFGEELGLTGLMALLLIYGLIVQRGLRAAIAVRDPFSKLLAGGLAFVVALQVFVIVGGVTRLIPLTGITTPFLSQGGSSLVASWMLIGLLMRISDTARRPAPQPIQDEGMTQVFIRSMATRGWLGGLAAATTEMTMLLDAAGFDVVLVETVGVGQDEVEIARLADVTVVVLVPGMGDDVQAIKAGIMEIADVFVINKSDLAGADKLERELHSSYRFRIDPTDGRRKLCRRWPIRPMVPEELRRRWKPFANIMRADRAGLARPISGAGVFANAAERLLERLPAAEFDAAGLEVAERRRDPYSILHDWLERI